MIIGLNKGMFCSLDYFCELNLYVQVSYIIFFLARSSKSVAFFLSFNEYEILEEKGNIYKK